MTGGREPGQGSSSRGFCVRACGCVVGRQIWLALCGFCVGAGGVHGYTSWGNARLYQLGVRAATKAQLLTRDFGTCIKRYHKIMLSLANQSTTCSGRAVILPISRVTSLCVFFVKGLPDGSAF